MSFADRRVVMLVSKEWPGLYLSTFLARQGIRLAATIVQQEPLDHLTLNLRQWRRTQKEEGLERTTAAFFGLPMGLSYLPRRIWNRREYPLLKDLERMKVPVHTVSAFLSEKCHALLRSLEPDVGVICGTPILPGSLLSIPRLCTINVHTSLLPYYRGGGSGFWPVLFRDLEKIGFTIHKAVASVDAGPYLYQEHVAPSSDGVQKDLLKHCFFRAAPQLARILREDPLDESSWKQYDNPIRFSFRSPPPVLKEYVYGPTAVQKIKRVAQSALSLIPPPAVRRSGEGRLAVFYFHQLLADSTPANDWRRILGHLTVSELRSRLLLAQRSFKFVDFPTFVNLAERCGSLDQNYALLTVDDAFRDFLTNAVPLLEELSIPSLLSVSSQAASTGALWYQRAYDLIAGIAADRLYVPWIGRHIYWGDQQYRVLVAENALLPQLKRMKPQRRLELVDELIKRNAAPAPADDLSAFCTVEELRTLQGFPFVQLCMHGDAHHPFETLSDEELALEVQACQSFFQDQLNSRTTVLCFPNGRFKDSQAPALQDLGIRYAFITKPGGWVTQKAFPFSIPRNGLTGGSSRDFRRRLASFVDS